MSNAEDVSLSTYSSRHYGTVPQQVSKDSLSRTFFLDDNESSRVLYESAARVDDPYVVFYAPTDPRHPLNWSPLRKYVVLAVVCGGAACVTAASSISASTEPQLQERFQVSAVVAALGVSLYVVGLGLGARELAYSHVVIKADSQCFSAQ